TYIQKKGICIGSVAPVLCDIFLPQCDRGIAQNLPTHLVSRVFRYVDDYLVLLCIRPDQYESATFNIISNTFVTQAQGLKLTHGLPTNCKLQFLDLQLSFEDNHTCWTYSPRSKKGLLPFDSAHSKIIKRGIVQSCLNAALQKSCEHSAKFSFEAQVQRLQDSGYTSSVLFDVAERLTTPNEGRKRSCVKKRRPAVIPCIHKISHNLKRIASRYDVQVALSAPDKLKKLCPKINSLNKISEQCAVNHTHMYYVNCSVNVVYEIPLSCGK
ncbi:unnamed protein product, partial [Ixodes hexagonus]